jgi:hypothetical protein
MTDSGLSAGRSDRYVKLGFYEMSSSSSAAEMRWWSPRNPKR